MGFHKISSSQVHYFFSNSIGSVLRAETGLRMAIFQLIFWEKALFETKLAGPRGVWGEDQAPRCWTGPSGEGGGRGHYAVSAQEPSYEAAREPKNPGPSHAV